MKHYYLILAIVTNLLSANAQKILEKKGISFNVTAYIRTGVEKDVLGDYPVIYTDKIDSKVVSVNNYVLGGKTYTYNSFDGQLRSAFNQVKVDEIR